MKILDYILNLSESNDNFIICNLNAGLGIHNHISEWSKDNPGYTYVSNGSVLLESLKRENINHEGLITRQKFSRILNGTDTIDSLINPKIEKNIKEGKIIFYNVSNVDTLRYNNFKFCLSHNSKSSFEKKEFNPVDKSYSIKNTGKEVINFRDYYMEFKKNLRRDRVLKSLLDE